MGIFGSISPASTRPRGELPGKAVDVARRGRLGREDEPPGEQLAEGLAGFARMTPEKAPPVGEAVPKLGLEADDVSLAQVPRLLNRDELLLQVFPSPRTLP